MRGRFRIGLFVALLLAFGQQTPTWAALPRTVAVRLFEAHRELQSFTLHGPFEVLQPVHQQFSGQYQLVSRNGQVQLLQKHHLDLQARQLSLQSLAGPALGIQAENLALRHYPGQVNIRLDRSRHLEITNVLPTQTYVALVVGSETPPGWPLEALKAQAVLTQTRLSRYQPGDTLGDSTQQEAYLGNLHRRPEVEKAVSQVWGQILTYQGQPITPFYHADCAGQTSDGRFLSPSQPLPWLSAVPCPFDRQSPFHQATRKAIPARVFTQAFPEGLPTVIRQDSAGRPLSLKFTNGASISGYDFWIRLGQRLGWDKAPGTHYALSRLPDGDVQITSTGAGHGVGLCQWGAAGMARQGKTYAQILRYYFPETALSKR